MITDEETINELGARNQIKKMKTEETILKEARIKRLLKGLMAEEKVKSLSIEYIIRRSFIEAEAGKEEAKKENHSQHREMDKLDGNTAVKPIGEGSNPSADRKTESEKDNSKKNCLRIGRDSGSVPNQEAILKELTYEDYKKGVDFCVKKAISLTREAERKSNEEEIKKLKEEINLKENIGSEIFYESRDRANENINLKQQLQTQKEKILEDLKELETEMINVWTCKDFDSELMNLTCHDEMCSSEGCGCKNIIQRKFEALKNKINHSQEVSKERKKE